MHLFHGKSISHTNICIFRLVIENISHNKHLVQIFLIQIKKNLELRNNWNSCLNDLFACNISLVFIQQSTGLLILVYFELSSLPENSKYLPVNFKNLVFVTGHNNCCNFVLEYFSTSQDPFQILYFHRQNRFDRDCSSLRNTQDRIESFETTNMNFNTLMSLK